MMCHLRNWRTCVKTHLGDVQLVPLATRPDPLQMLGTALVAPNGYVLPFELASVLLLAALIGAIVVAWDRKK